MNIVIVHKTVYQSSILAFIIAGPWILCDIVTGTQQLVASYALAIPAGNARHFVLHGHNYFFCWAFCTNHPHPKDGVMYCPHSEGMGKVLFTQVSVCPHPGGEGGYLPWMRVTTLNGGTYLGWQIPTTLNGGGG